MSEMSEGEYLYQLALCEEAGKPEEPPALLVPRGMWTVRGGKTLRIVDMTTPHLRNAIRLFSDAGWEDNKKILELRLELARRGETEDYLPERYKIGE